MARRTSKTEIVPDISGFDSAGFSGLRHSAGRIEDEFLRELRGPRGLRRLRVMRENDAVIGGMMAAISTLMRGATWHANPCEDDGVPGDVRLADAVFLEEVIDDMDSTWTEFMSEAVSMLWFGFALFEEVYKIRLGNEGRYRSAYRDGRVGLAKLAGRAQESVDRWVIDDNGEILGAVQIDPATGKTVRLPMSKLLHLRTSTERGNPQGRSVIRNAYTAWRKKVGIEETEVIAIEREAAGIPAMLVPASIMSGSASPAEKAQFEACQRLVRNIRADEQASIVLPSDRDEHGNLLYELQMLSGGGGRSVDIDKAVQRHNVGMAQSVLADFLQLGHESTGSFALSSDKTRLFAVSIGAYLDMIAEGFNRQVIPRLWEVNGWNRPTPYLVHGDIETPDLAALGAYITALTGAGVDLTDPETVRDLRRAASLPDAPEGAV